MMNQPITIMSLHCSCCSHFKPASVHAGSQIITEAPSNIVSFEGSKERIKKLFTNVQLSASSYDTAWVAMVPSPNSPKTPCFPQCLNWLLNNQLYDGSWGLPHQHPLLLKDNLFSTLASIVALKQWSVGEDQINKGLHFLASNFSAVMDENQHSPFGFDIIFPSMLEYAKDLNLTLPLERTDLNAMLHKRDLEIKRCRSQKKGAYLAYVSEGLGSFYDAKLVMKYQMKNGSLFNSPSATAAAFIHHQNVDCFNYLSSILDKFGDAVPTTYPLDLYMRLCVVDNLERLGIGRHFKVEIENVLDETYRCWVHGDEQIFTDVLTCVVAFRLLRTHGYGVSADVLAAITCKNTLGEPFKDVYEALEVYHASQIMFHDELALGEQSLKSSDFLKQHISNPSIPSDKLAKFISLEVENALKFPFYDGLERISSKRNIECYNVENIRTLKTSYCSSNISNKDYLRLAVEDFGACQSIYREEMEYLERWVVENRLDKLEFSRQKTAYSYFSVASTLSSPELSDARISWAKSSILAVVLDDFFDVSGSMDELVNLIQSFEKWDVNVDCDCCSEAVGILLLALKNVINWIGEKAFKWQSRSVTNHVIETWLNFMKCMLKEAIWSKDNQVPTLNEYMEVAYVSLALGPIVLPTLYLVGLELSDEVVGSSEYHNLFKLMSTRGRLLNDIQTFEREAKEGKMNAVTLQMSNGAMKKEVVQEMKVLIDNQRSKMLRLVLEEKESIVPRDCKDVFWKMCNVLDFFYGTYDGLTGNAISDIVQAIIYQPLSLETEVKVT